MISGHAFGAYGMPAAMLAPANPLPFVRGEGLGPLAASTNSMYGATDGGGLLGRFGPLEVTGLLLLGFVLISGMADNRNLRRSYR